jgi:hypothetical protein
MVSDFSHKLWVGVILAQVAMFTDSSIYCTSSACVSELPNVTWSCYLRFTILFEVFKLVQLYLANPCAERTV